MSEIDMESDKDFTTEENRKYLVYFALETLETDKNFQLISALGQGAFGDVYKMYDPEREADIAIKIVTPENTTDLESTLWPQLEHRNILPLLDILTLSPKDVTIFVMPLQQKSLYDLLHDESFFMRPGCFYQVKEWLFEVLCALEYLSSNNLCHLDIKVDNVLISEQSTAMLCDFSFLNVTDAPINRYYLGLPYIYRPPELCRTQEEEVCVDGAAYDMWGYGIMGVEILTHFVIASKTCECDCWMNEIYPILFDALQEEEFANLITKAFDADEIEEVDIKLALNFIHIFLETDSLKRASAVTAKTHVFLNHGFSNGVIKDDIWIHRKGDTSPSNEEILKVIQTVSNNAGDMKTILSSVYRNTDSGHSAFSLSYSDSGDYEELFQINYGTVVEHQTPARSSSIKKRSEKPFKIEKRCNTPRFRGNEISNRNVKTLKVSKSSINLESASERVNNDTQDTEMTSLRSEETHIHMKIEDQFTNDDSEFQLMWGEITHLNGEETVSTNPESNEPPGAIVYPKRSPILIPENEGRGYALHSKKSADKTSSTQDSIRYPEGDFSSMKCGKETALNECCKETLNIMAETKDKWASGDGLEMGEVESSLMKEKEIPSISKLMCELTTNETTNKDIGIVKAFNVLLPETTTRRNILSKARNVIDKFQKILTFENRPGKEEKIHTDSSHCKKIVDLGTPPKKLSNFKSDGWIRSKGSINEKRLNTSRGKKILNWFRRRCLYSKCVCTEY